MVTAIEENNNKRCPHCNLKAGKLKIEHEELGIKYYECAFWRNSYDNRINSTETG